MAGPYLLDAAVLGRVWAGGGADLTAGPGGLVDEGARGTRPLHLRRHGRSRSHPGHVADTFIQSDLLKVHLSAEGGTTIYGCG